MARPKWNFFLAIGTFLVAYASAFAQFAGGPLEPKKIRPGDACPVSTGSDKTVPRVPYIFCTSCIWFGIGPAYFTWAYGLGHGNDAVFELVGVPNAKSVYSTKTPWVAKSDYAGPISISGHQLDGKGTLRFDAAGSKMQKRFVFTAPNHEAGDHWSFWPAGMDIPHPGCYVVEIETTTGKDFVIFKAEDNPR